jgi:hypothetical protein
MPVAHPAAERLGKDAGNFWWCHVYVLQAFAA